jgi:hypothetical protein
MYLTYSFARYKYLSTSPMLIVLEVCDMSPRLPLDGLSPLSERGM